MRERRAAAEKVAAQLTEVEHAIDAALQKAAQLVGAMPAARIEAQISAIVGQAAMERSSGVVQHLMQARREIVETHKELSATQIQIGLGSVALGEGNDKGISPEELGVASAGLLRAVR
jgi:hypothetical protein